VFDVVDPKPLFCAMSKTSQTNPDNLPAVVNGKAKRKKTGGGRPPGNRAIVQSPDLTNGNHS
jgi:hypothetical protein